MDSSADLVRSADVKDDWLGRCRWCGVCGNDQGSCGIRKGCCGSVVWHVRCRRDLGRWLICGRWLHDPCLHGLWSRLCPVIAALFVAGVAAWCAASAVASYAALAAATVAD